MSHALTQVRRNVSRRLLSRRTLKAVQFDLLRLRARMRHAHDGTVTPPSPLLHLGCGRRMVPGWHNVDVAGSDYDVDLGCGRLPWRDDAFDAVVSQQVIEHLELHHELIPLLREVNRVVRPGGEVWLACPDMEKVCRSYLAHQGRDLLDDRLSRWEDFDLKGAPPQQMINVLFHQGGEHRNLYDFELLRWAVHTAGLTECVRVSEADFNERFPEFPVRGDDYSSLYVRARAT